MPAFKILKDFCKYRHLGISKKTRSMHFNWDNQFLEHIKSILLANKIEMIQELYKHFPHRFKVECTCCVCKELIL